MRKRITKRSVDLLAPKRRDAFLWDSDLTGFGCKVTPNGRKVYVFQYRPRGRTYRQSPKRITLGKYGELTPDQARKLAAELAVAVKAGHDPAMSRISSGTPTVADLTDRFLKEYLPNKKRPPRAYTIKLYESLFRCHVDGPLGKRPVKEIGPADLERLHTSMKDKPYAANRTLSLLQQAFDQAERWGWRPQHTNPAVHIERYREERRGSKKEVMLTAGQMKDLLKAIDAEQKDGGSAMACDAIRVAFWTGWRISEVLGLEWNNIDLSSGAARLVRTKTAEEEYRQLPSEAISILRGMTQVAGCPFVFPGRNPQEHLSTVRKTWMEIRKHAGLNNLNGLGAFRLHDLRHNVVSWDVSRGVPLEIAGKNVGHRSRRSTEVYAHFAPTALKKAADARAQAMREALESTNESS